MLFKDKTWIEKLSFIVSIIAGFLFIIFGLNQMLGFMGDVFIGKSIFIQSKLVAGIIDIIIAIIILLLEFEFISTTITDNYLFRGVLYIIFGLVLSLCATITTGGLLYIIAYFIIQR